MFTGLIESLGTIKAMGGSAGKRRITVSAPQVASQLKAGDSVAVNGVCLTALEITADSFAADLAQETIERTSLTQLKPGARVNLELPTRAGTPLGGHIVQGHVDGVGRVLSLNRIADDWQLRLRIPGELAKCVVAKGSIAVEGISLTVAAIADDEVTIAIIPHTHKVTNLHTLSPGDPVNIEVDVLAKYAEKMQSASTESGVTVERLLSEGF